MDVPDLTNLSSIESFIAQRIQEKNKEYLKNCYYNEFFTPFELIVKMISHIPSSFWNLQTQWLEPTCGEGFFMMVIFHRLFHHPSHQHLSTEERTRHIMANLFLNDLCPENVEKVRAYGFPSTNVTHYDCLQLPSEQKYDIIIGNPPFQTPSSNYLSGNRKSSKLYLKVTEKCLSLLRDGGHLAFITPLNLWAGKGLKSSLYETMIRDYCPQYIFTDNLKKRWFPHVGQNLKMCFFVIANKQAKDPAKDPAKDLPRETVIESKGGHCFSVRLKEGVNPVEDWTMENVALLEEYLTSRTNYFQRTPEIPVHGEAYESKTEWTGAVLKTLDLDRPYILQNPHRLYFVKEIPKEIATRSMIGMEKYILFRMKPFAKGIHDTDGTFYLSSQIFFLPLGGFTKEEKENIVRFFHSERYQKIMKLTTTSQFMKGGVIECLNIDFIKKGLYATLATP